MCDKNLQIKWHQKGSYPLNEEHIGIVTVGELTFFDIGVYKRQR